MKSTNVLNQRITTTTFKDGSTKQSKRMTTTIAIAVMIKWILMVLHVKNLKRSISFG